MGVNCWNTRSHIAAGPVQVLPEKKKEVFSGPTVHELFFNIANHYYLIWKFKEHRGRPAEGKTPVARGRYCFTNLAFETSQSNSLFESREKMPWREMQCYCNVEELLA